MELESEALGLIHQTPSCYTNGIMLVVFCISFLSLGIIVLKRIWYRVSVCGSDS